MGNIERRLTFGSRFFASDRPPPRRRPSPSWNWKRQRAPCDQAGRMNDHNPKQRNRAGGAENKDKSITRVEAGRGSFSSRQVQCQRKGHRDVPPQHGRQVRVEPSRPTAAHLFCASSDRSDPIGATPVKHSSKTPKPTRVVPDPTTTTKDIIDVLLELRKQKRPIEALGKARRGTLAIQSPSTVQQTRAT